MGKILPFKPRAKPEPVVEDKGPSPLEAALEELASQYTQEELDQMFEELDDLIDEDDAEALKLTEEP